MSRFDRVSLHVGLLIAIGLALIAFAPASPAAPQGPLIIPLGLPPAKLDGQCDPAGEWSDALALSYIDGSASGGKVYLKHDNVNLYVCLQGVSGQNAARFASVYLDTLDSRKQFAGATDYALRTDFTLGLHSSFMGTDVPNGYVPTTLGGWSVATSTGNLDVAEYSIPLALTGGWCGKPFGLAAYHHWVSATGNDYGWPSNQFFDQPPTWGEMQLGSLFPCAGISDIAYVYQDDTVAANDFKGLLAAAGFNVDLIAQSTITAATSFSSYHVILVADDTGSLNNWGAGPSQVTPITGAGKPILGIGEGGYAFFGRLGSPVGWPRGWHRPQQFIRTPSPVPASYYVDPYNLSGLTGAPIQLYQTLVNEVAIYVPGQQLPAGVTVLGWEPPATPQSQPDHAPLITEGCHQLWGFGESPTRMTEEGRRLFINAVIYSRFHSTCAPPPPTINCLTLNKVAQPPDGSTVHPGDAINYTLSYIVTNNAQCATLRALLSDPLPDHSLFIPGSAGPGVVPNFAGTLQWDLTPLAIGTQGNKSFKVSVLDTACRSGLIANTAQLQTNLGTFTSNTTTHKVDCSPVVPPNNDPPYAESEIQVYPYPLVAGTPTQLSVRVFNNSAIPQTVTVTFQSSNNQFGIGVPFTTLPLPGNPRVLTIGASGNAEVVLNWTPTFSGHTGIQAKIENAGYAPIYTSRNLDVTEDLQPGVTDMLTFAVANPTAVTATITLVVVNTCPGWTASVNPPQIVNAVPGTNYTAMLSVTPPSPATLGSGCHIDVQGWIGDLLIGGIRKLDVPPVHLPHTDPPWLEKEISSIPTVPIAGVVNQACIELQNPLAVARTVTVRFSEADFGAGIGFTLFSTQVLTLPPHSLAKYCVAWTPALSGTLHRCLLVQLDQAGWQTQLSQHNLDIERRPVSFDPASVHLPFSIGNPFPFPGRVRLNGILIGLNQYRVGFTPDPGPGGVAIGVGETRGFTLELVPAVQMMEPQKAQQANGVSFAGDVVRADVEVLVNDRPASGFSMEFAPPKILDIDGNGTYDALTDGLLVIRSLFGLSGPSLINGAVGPLASRTTDTAIGTYLADIRPLLDIDGNGQSDALTDGLLIIRYLFGLRGASLIAGAVASDASRFTFADLETQIQSLTPP